MFPRPRCCPLLLWPPKNMLQEIFQNFKIGAVVFELWFFKENKFKNNNQIFTCHDLVFVIHIDITLFGSNDQLYIFYWFIRIKKIFKTSKFPYIKVSNKYIADSLQTKLGSIVVNIVIYQENKCFFLITTVRSILVRFYFFYAKMYVSPRCAPPPTLENEIWL